MNAYNLMNRSSPTPPKAPGSRLWLWLTVPPLAAMVGAAITITLALTHPDPVIHANLQKVGKAMVRDNRAARAAQALSLSARLQRDGSSGAIHLVLRGEVRPTELQVLWIHPTRAALDRGAILLPVAGAAGADVSEYRGVLPEPPAASVTPHAGSGHGTWVVQDAAQTWALEAPAQSTAGGFELVPVVR